MNNWQPVIAALAALIVAATPGILALINSRVNNSRIHHLENGQAADLQGVIRALERLSDGRVENARGIAANSAVLDALHRRLDVLGAPPASKDTPK